MHIRLTKLNLLGTSLLGLVGLGLLSLTPQAALAANPTTMSFQGKVVNSDGTNVTNGTYSFVFRIYNTASPTMTTSCTSTATCLWQETQGSVSVTSGVFQVELGSACALTSGSCNNAAGGPINFSSSSSLYLTMQFNGDTSGSNGGFMSPTIHITSVPFAFQADNASNLGGIASSGYLQLAPNAVQTDTSTTNVSIFVNKNNASGTPKIVEIQKSSVDVLAIDNGGALTVTPSGSNIGTIIRQTSGTATSGNILDVQGANGTSHFIQVTQTAANQGSISITSLGSNGLTLQAGSGTVTLGGSTSLTATGALSVASGGSSALTLDSLSGTLGFGANTTTLQKSATNLTLDVTNASNSTLTVTNSGAGTASISIESGGSYTGLGAVTVDSASGTQLSVGTGANAHNTVVGSTNGGSSLTLQSGSGNINLSPSAGNDVVYSEAAGSQLQINASAATTIDQVSISNASGATSTNGVDGLGITFNTTGSTASADNSGLRIDATSGSTGTSATLEGLKIGDLTDTGTATTTGLYVGTGWDIGIDIQSGGLQLAAQTDPVTPATGNLRIYAKDIAGRILPKWVGPSGVDTPFQANFGFNRISMMAPAGSGTNCGTGVSMYGSTAVGSSAGSATGCSYPVLTSTNLASSVRRFRYTSGTTAGVLGFQRQAALMVWRGNAVGTGGFFYTTRFTLNTTQSGNRAFVGLADSIGTPTNVDPTTNTSPGKIGVAINANTGNWKFVNNITGTAPTVTDLGASIPVNTTDLLELILYSASNGSSIGYRVTDISTGGQTSGSVSTNIPASTTFLDPILWITNNATAAAAILDSAGWYLESDN